VCPKWKARIFSWYATFTAVPVFPAKFDIYEAYINMYEGLETLCDFRYYQMMMQVDFLYKPEAVRNYKFPKQGS
jgi:hypothetical protein